MELYIEKAFIDNLYLGLDFKNLTPSQKVLINIFKEYGEVEKFMDVSINTAEELESLKTSNILIAYLNIIHPVISINSIKDHFFEKSECKQTIILTQKVQNWFEDAEKKGALCFSYDNYENRINTIINELHFKVDLSEGFKGWGFLKKFKNLNYNQITVTDGYILVDKDYQEMEDNLIPILKELFLTKSKVCNVDIFTKEIDAIKTNGGYSEERHIKEKAKKRYNVLKNNIPKLNTIIQIIFSYNKNYRMNNGDEFDFHDRIIQTNFSLMDSGKGFNLVGSTKQSNSQIISATIFEKYTYNRLKNHKKMQSRHINSRKTLKYSFE